MDSENQFELVQSMLKQIKIDEPGIRQFIEQQIRNSEKKRIPNEISNETIRRLRIQTKKLQEQVASLKEQLKLGKIDRNLIMNKLNYLTKLNTSLADALGSCKDCWGEDQECTVCSGEGYSGWRKINIRLFNLYVLPSLEKLYR